MDEIKRLQKLAGLIKENEEEDFNINLTGTNLEWEYFLNHEDTKYNFDTITLSFYHDNNDNLGVWRHEYKDMNLSPYDFQALGMEEITIPKPEDCDVYDIYNIFGYEVGKKLHDEFFSDGDRGGDWVYKDDGFNRNEGKDNDYYELIQNIYLTDISNRTLNKEYEYANVWGEEENSLIDFYK
jgi:hypothetical protein